MRGHEVVVKLLVKRHNVKADSSYGRTPLSLVACGGQEVVVKPLQSSQTRWLIIICIPPEYS